MLAETVSLGVLSLPYAMATLGVVPYVQHASICEVSADD